METLSARIIVAIHKQSKMPRDEMYLPLQVGAACMKNENGEVIDFGYAKDNEGENISELNAGFCELTGLYWAWKNISYDYIGLVHYRRFFSLSQKNGIENVLKYEELKPYLGKIRVFVPKKRWYVIETLYSHYAHTHYASHLYETGKVIKDLYPEYLDSFSRALRQRYGYMFNVMIMEYDLLDEYCTWLFSVLFELKKRLGALDYDFYQGRLFGRVSEILFNVWLTQKISSGEILKNQIKELQCKYMDNIDWKKKGKAFLCAKFFGKKYEE